MRDSTHLVFGAGLIGCFLAGALSQTQPSISLVARKSVRDKYQGGIKLSDYLGNSETTNALRFISDDEAHDHFDIIWLTVKCTSVTSAIPELKRYCSDSTIIICCQNGLESDKPIREAFPNNNIITAVVGYNVIDREENNLHRSTQGELLLQEDKRLESLVTMIDSEIMPCKTSSNIVATQWAKLQLNLANSVNAIADIPVKAMTENAQFRKVIAALMQELLNVSNAKEMTLPRTTALPAKWLPYSLKLPNLIYLKIAQKMLAIDPDARTSMWWDLQAGKKTEVDFINGAVVTQGKSIGIDCPFNEKITTLIHQIEQGKASIGFSPDKLTAYLELN